jgi:hypothetical protein
MAMSAELEDFDIEGSILQGIKENMPEKSSIISFENERGKPLMHA